MLMFLAALLVPAALQAPAQQVDVTYLREMPSIEAVLAAITGKGPLDTPARQGAAFHHLREMIYYHAGPRRYTNQLTPSEQAMVQRYLDGYARVVNPITRRYDPKAFRQTDALNQERVRFYELLYGYQADRALVEELLTRFFSPAWRARFEGLVEADARRLASREASAASTPSAAGAGADPTLPPEFREFERMVYRIRQGMIGVTAVVVVLLLVLEFGPLTISIEESRIKVGPRRFTIHCTAGEVMDAKKWSETHVSTSGGGSSMTPDGYYTARPVTVHSSVVTRDEIFIRQPDGVEHALQLSNIDLPARAGQKLAAVWLIRRGKKSGSYVLFHNYAMRDTRWMEGALTSVFRVHWWPFFPLMYLAWELTHDGLLTFLAVAGFVVLTHLVCRSRVARAKVELERWVTGPLGQVAAQAPQPA